MERPLGLVGFATQSRLAHALTVAGGVAIFWLGYFGAVALVYGDVAVLAPAASVEEQRVGGLAGGFLVWTYFALAFVRGYGGPVLNATAYPTGIAVLGPFAGRWLLFGPDLAGLFDRFVGWGVEPLLTAGTAIVPGGAAFIAVLTVWAAILPKADRRAWERRHLPDPFYDAFVAGADESEPGAGSTG